jgi:Zn-dependent protease/CBS domain-containing protein
MDERTRQTGAQGSTTGPRIGFRVGQVAGVEIRVDWSLALVFWLIAMNLGVGLFPMQHPEWSLALVWTMALAAALLFFVSVLAHEFAHAVVARANGLRVSGITLFVFGGMAHIEEEPRSARVEFLMAAMGPVTSLAIGALAILIGTRLVPRVSLTDDTITAWAHLPPLASLLLWLGPVNILLGLFNLLPGFPLDGGRVLRALLWQTTGDLEKATRWSAASGRVLAFGLMFIGAAMIFGVRVPVFGTGFLGGLWLIFIGWFLNSAAVQSYQQVAIRHALGNLPVLRLMRPEAAAVEPEMPISTFVDQYMLRGDVRCYAVVTGDLFRGMVCMSDLGKVARQDWDSRTVADIMTPVDALSMVTPVEPVIEALRKLSTRDMDQVPVVDAGRLLGMLRRSDILRWIELRMPAHAPG